MFYLLNINSSWIKQNIISPLTLAIVVSMISGLCLVMFPSYLIFILVLWGFSILFLFVKPVYGITLFPIFFFFTEFSIPFFGSPERLIAATIFPLFLLRQMVEKKELNFDRVVLVSFLIFIFCNTLSLYNAEPVLYSANMLLRLVSKGILAYLIFALIESERQLITCIKFLTLFLLILCGSTLLLIWCSGSVTVLRKPEYLWAGSSYLKPFTYSILSNPNLVSRSVILTMPIVYAFSYMCRQRRAALLTKLVSIVSLSICFIGISRTAIAVTGLIIIAILLKFKDRASLIVILLFFMLLSFFAALPQFNVRFRETLSIDSWAIQPRLVLARAALERFKIHPLLGDGRGLGFTQVQANIGQGTYEYHGEKRLYEHNLLLTTLVQNGLIGVAALLLLIGCYFKFLKNSLNQLNDGPFRSLLFSAMIGISGFLLTTLSGGMIEENILWYTVGLSFAIVKLQRQNELMKN